MTTGSYTGEPFTIERGPLDFYLLDSGNNSDLTLMDEDEEERRNSVTVFPGCDMRKTITSDLPLENGKIYNFKVTI